MTMSDDIAAFNRMAAGYSEMASNATEMASITAALADLCERLNRTAASDFASIEQIEAEFEALIAKEAKLKSRRAPLALV
ncbi:MAG TPA: hypothetical protein VGX71_25440 [Pseudaminobacter sp.]|nr:hypothetical protein [Pseudaminobacter sp.]